MGVDGAMNALEKDNEGLRVSHHQFMEKCENGASLP